MKLRVLEDSVRLRLLEPEVERIANDETVVGTTRFPSGNALEYRLSTGDVDEVCADLSVSTIGVVLPKSIAHAWAQTDQVSIEHMQALSTDGGELRILVEKDFECLDPDEKEDQTGTFKNPNAG